MAAKRTIQLKRRPGQERLLQRFREELNEQQYKAATAVDGANLILAGPGSGKTRVMIYRVAFLIGRGVRPDSILLVTFTRRASREMVSRLEGLIGPKGASVWAGTFHHVANRLLRRSDHAKPLGLDPSFSILDSEDQRELITLAMTQVGLAGRDAPRGMPKPPRVLGLISMARNLMVPLKTLISERATDLIDLTEDLTKAAESFANRKRTANCVDYDDLLGYWLTALTHHPELNQWQGRQFSHVLVDEMQDTNLLQSEILETLARAGEGNLTVVGDDAQSIYRFRGANYDNILKFPDRHGDCQIFRLERNYRSTPQIVELVNASISRNQTGFAKTLVAANEQDGEKPWMVPTEDGYQEAEFLCQQIRQLHDEDGLAYSEIAVLYRNHYDSLLLQGELVNQGIPYTIRSGLRFFEQAHIKDVLAHLRILANPRDGSSWRRLLQLLPGIGPAKSESLSDHLTSATDPIQALRTPETMKLVPTRARGHFAGFVADLTQVREAKPETDPSQAIERLLKGGYPALMATKYENPRERQADLEQLVLLAARYDSLDRLLTDLLLAGDLYGADTLQVDEQPSELLCLTTVHQAKGLEWPVVFVMRLIEDGFPHARAIDESEGLEEERRLFYVATSRAQNLLILTYPLVVTRGGGVSVLTQPSRFLTELPEDVLEPIRLV